MQILDKGNFDRGQLFHTKDNIPQGLPATACISTAAVIPSLVWNRSITLQLSLYSLLGSSLLTNVESHREIDFAIILPPTRNKGTKYYFRRQISHCLQSVLAEMDEAENVVASLFGCFKPASSFSSLSPAPAVPQPSAAVRCITTTTSKYTSLGKTTAFFHAPDFSSSFPVPAHGLSNCATKGVIHPPHHHPPKNEVIKLVAEF